MGTVTHPIATTHHKNGTCRPMNIVIYLSIDDFGASLFCPPLEDYLQFIFLCRKPFLISFWLEEEKR
jgi:hypothetical protein